MLRSIVAIMVYGLPGWRAAPTLPKGQQAFLASGPRPTPISPEAKSNEACFHIRTFQNVIKNVA